MGRGPRNADSHGMGSRTANVTVFLADDSPAIRHRVNGMLQHADFTIVGEGATPQGCIDGILRMHPDVVVLDHQLEGGTGLQVLKAVRQADPQVAFVVFSNNSAAAYRKRYLGEGAVGFLDKSTEFDQLATAVALAAAGGHALH
jgi:two-component system response regulator DesR